MELGRRVTGRGCAVLKNFKKLSGTGTVVTVYSRFSR